MSAPAPEPSMIVVFSLPTSMRLAWPRSASVTFSSVRPTSSEITLPPVRIAMSSSIALRRSPKPGALTATTFRMPRMVLTTSVASASPSTSSATISSGRPDLATCSSVGSRSRMLLIFLKQQHERVVERSDLLVGVVDEVGREVAAVELHALDDFQLRGERLAVFDGDDAFLADLVHRVGDDAADFLVAVRRDRANLGDFLRGRRRLRLLLQLLDERRDGLVDAALQVHRVHARGHVLHAFPDDGLRQYGRGGGAVTGDVAGLGSDFLDHLRAHVLELVLELDLLGDRDTVLGDRRAAERTLEHHVATLRAEGDLDRVGQDVHAFDHAM